MNYLLTLLVVFVYMNAWFAWSLIRRRNDVVDTAWGLGFVVVAWSSGLIGGGFAWPALMVNGLITLWGIRLASHIYMRNRKKPEDKRYQQLVPPDTRYRIIVSYLKIFMLQGVLMWVITLPVQSLNFSLGYERVAWLVSVGLVVWVFGFYFEVRADAELREFLSRKNHPPVLKTGLWKYSRHPNYFGEVSMWWGVYLIAVGGGASLSTVVGPMMITYLILYVSGVPMLEKRYAKDEDYQKYAAQTSKFIPLPPRK